MRCGLRRLVIVAAAEWRDAGEAVADIEGVGDFAEFAVTDDVDSGRDLLFDVLVDGFRQTFRESRLVEFTAIFSRFEEGQKLGRPRQAADMRGEDAVGAGFHFPVVPSDAVAATTASL